MRDFAKLTADARAARDAAIAAADASKDGGTCNLDACAFHLEKREPARQLVAALQAAGLSVYETKWLGRCVMVSPPGDGQADKRAKSNEAFIKHMRAAGWALAGYYQID